MRMGQFAIGLGAVALVAAAVWALMPEPVAVDQAVVRVAPMEVTVSAEGMTRTRDLWSVTAPISGTVSRSPVEVGDAVVQGKTAVAIIEPAAPALLDTRARAQAEAAVSESQAAVRLAEVVLTKAEADLAYAEAQLTRNRALSQRGTIAERVLEDSQQAAVSAAAARDSARFDLEMHRATLARMQAQLASPDLAADGAAACCTRIVAPHSGTVLEIVDASARLVQAGSPLLTIGDLDDLQVEVDLLSSDAVRVRPGALAYVERWGGEPGLKAHVARIDPAAFTRVSALGIEEQRVRLRLDLDSTPPEGVRLGDRFRVFVRVVVWSDPGTLQVPQSALFRQGAGWAVFRVVDGRARSTPVTVGQTQEDAAQVLAGLAEGDVVVTYPGSRVAEGTRLALRPAP